MLTYGNLAKMMSAKTIDYDQNGVPTLVRSLLLQYRRNQRPINFSIVNEY